MYFFKAMVKTHYWQTVVKNTYFVVLKNVENYTAGKISNEHITIFLSKYLFKGAVDLKFSPDVGNNPSNPYIQRKHNK